MRRLIVSLGLGALVLGAAFAQSGGGNGSVPQLPVGQTYKDFQFPMYQDGQLKASLAASEARGITLNRAATTNLKVELYEAGKVTTTVTSPNADLYVADRKLRTKSGIVIERADLEATAQIADFDLFTRKYFLQGNVRVVLKNVSLASGSGGSSGAIPRPARAAAPPAVSPAPARDGSLLDMPGAYSNGDGSNPAPARPSPP